MEFVQPVHENCNAYCSNSDYCDFYITYRQKWHLACYCALLLASSHYATALCSHCGREREVFGIHCTLQTMRDCTDEPDSLCRLHFTSLSSSSPVRGAKGDKTQQLYYLKLPKVCRFLRTIILSSFSDCSAAFSDGFQLMCLLWREMSSGRSLSLSVMSFVSRLRMRTFKSIRFFGFLPSVLLWGADD